MAGRRHVPRAGADERPWGEPGFETRAIHAGQPPDPLSGAVIPAVSFATTFAQEAAGQHKGFDYARTSNPTRAALETCLASLEGAAHGLAFASGMAAEDALLHCLSPGDHIIIPDDAYGGTFRLINGVWGTFGISHTPVRMTDLDAVRAAWQPSTRLVWTETPSNPMLLIVDIEPLAALAHERGGLLVVDNTFATPYLQQPLAHGADVVVHSMTKYLGGHSDVVGGFLATDDGALAERLAFYQNSVGGVPGTDGLLPGSEGDKDAGRSHGPPLRQRDRRGRHAVRPPGCGASPVPRA